MDDVSGTISEAKKVILTSYEIWSMVAAFVFGGLTSAVWTFKEAKRRPSFSELVSTVFVSGMIAVGFVCLLMRYGIDMPLVIAVSILCGFSGDALVKGTIRTVLQVASSILSPSLLSILTKKSDKEDSSNEPK